VYINHNINLDGRHYRQTSECYNADGNMKKAATPARNRFVIYTTTRHLLSE